MPNGSVEFVLQFGNLYENQARGGFIEPRAAIFGPLNSVNIIRPLGRAELAGIRFKPGALHYLTRVPAHLLVNEILTPGEVDYLFTASEISQLLDFGTERAIHFFDQMLLKKMSKADCTQDSRVSHAMSLLDGGDKFESVGKLHKEVCLSARQFETVFKTYIGFSAKKYARIQRFNKALNLLMHRQPFDLTEVSNRFSYYDQSHFINEFKEFSGLSPGQFIQRHRGNFIFD